MPQLNIYLGNEDSLKVRLDQAAGKLGTTPNGLARQVLDEFLDTYVGVVLDAESIKRQAFLGIHDRLKRRADVMGDARFASSDEIEYRRLEPSRIMPSKRRGTIAARRQG
jgi:hypothetical protein